MTAFPSLFSPIEIGGLRIRNRIFSPAHGTTLGSDGCVSDALIAYHEARAAGGAGLIIIEGMTLHPTYAFPDLFLYAGDDKVVPGLARLATAVQAHDCKILGQLFHAGRAVRASYDGSRPVTVSASAVPDERYKIVPRALGSDEIKDIVAAYGAAARRCRVAGLDGVEIIASMGYLVAQFLNSRTNRRDDGYGGALSGRMRFLQEILMAARDALGEQGVLGLRISGDERERDGLSPDEVIEICRRVDAFKLVDYFNVTAGSSASPAGWVHVFPPMAMSPGYVAPAAAAIKAVVEKPVLVAGRINQPQEAERILQAGQADMIGMARAMICDPDFASKAASGRAEDIRACIGCNQACVGHRLAHHGISCIQHPETGRELTFGKLKPTKAVRNVAVVGGGPGGMKAAAVAAARGHGVTLYEREKYLGGQAWLAQQLPGRAEFGGLITNLEREMALAGVTVRTDCSVGIDLLRETAPDMVIVATGAQAARPEIEGEGHIVEAYDVVRGTANVGSSVVIADWRCDWVGLGVAEKLARDGCRVRLLVDGTVAGETIQGIVRDLWIAELHKLGVEIVTYARLYGLDGDTAYFEQMVSGEAIVCEEVDTLVVANAPRASTDLLERLQAEWQCDVVAIGDCLSPRTAEEAVLEGLEAAWEI